MSDIVMLAIDLDGTLLTDDKRISDANARAIREAMDAGVKVCIATGRAWPGAKEYARELGVDAPVVTSNGAMIVDPVTEEVLFDLGLSGEDARAVYARGEQEGLTQIVWSKCQFFASRMNELAVDYGHRFGRMNPTAVPSIDELCERGVSKILWYCPNEDAEEYRKKVLDVFGERISVVTSMPSFLEFFHRGLSKAEAVRRVADRYGIRMDEVAGFGDAGNDIPLLQMTGIGVAVGNASDEAKQAADLVTADNEHDGVALAIREILRRRFYEGESV